MQQIPFLLGRLMAHKTSECSILSVLCPGEQNADVAILVNYVDQLNRVATGDCEWISNYN